MRDGGRPKKKEREIEKEKGERNRRAKISSYHEYELPVSSYKKIVSCIKILDLFHFH